MTLLEELRNVIGDRTDDDALALIERISELESQSIDDLKNKLGIDITPYIEEVEVATPMTFARYLGTPDGTPYGFEVSEWDGVLARMMDIEADFNVKGLRHIGAGSFFGDGYSSTWINGDMTAGLACAELDKGGEQ